jgi:hypothetical protein
MIGNITELAGNFALQFHAEPNYGKLSANSSANDDIFYKRRELLQRDKENRRYEISTPKPCVISNVMSKVDNDNAERHMSVIHHNRFVKGRYAMDDRS